MTATKPLTIIAEIAELALLKERLREIQASLDDNPWFDVAALEHTHFTRFVIVEDRELAPVLVWEVNYDGDETAYLTAALANKIGNVFSCCTGFTGDLRWFRERTFRAPAFYCAYPGIAQREIANDFKVHAALRKIADDPEVMQLQPQVLHRRLREDVAKTGLETTPIADARSKLRMWLYAIGLGIAAIAMFVPILLIWYPILRKREREDPVSVIYHPVDDNGLALEEDKIRQNQLTHIVDLKPGRFRFFTLWMVLNVIGILASKFYVNGHLGGITSIHFARWVIVRDRRDVPRAQRRDRLFFFSNYDGSWESYLGEFIDRASMGLSAIWSNTEGFPRTSNLIFAGALDEEHFKQWTRDHQIPTQVWMSWVPLSTVQNVRDDVWLRRRLETSMNDKDLTTWLRKV